NALETAFEGKQVLTNNLRVSAGAAVAYYDISGGMTGIDGRHDGTIQSVSFGVRYHPIDRSHAPFGLSLSVEPHWDFADSLTGKPADQIGAEFAALVDRELIPGRMFGAVNVSYEPDYSRLHATGDTSHESRLGLGAAFTVLTPNRIFVGAEIR